MITVLENPDRIQEEGMGRRNYEEKKEHKLLNMQSFSTTASNQEPTRTPLNIINYYPLKILLLLLYLILLLSVF